MKWNKLTRKLTPMICIMALAIIIIRALAHSKAASRSMTASQLVDRAGAAPTPATDRMIYALQQKLRAKPADSQSLAYLGNAYLQKVRETGEPSYYQKAAQVFDQAIKNDPLNADALTGMGNLCLARHAFHAALDWGNRAAEISPYKAAALGVVGDAQIELGRYDQAVHTIQKMVNLRPDLSSYSRVSYIRELLGDVPGAIEAMQLAVSAGGPALENTNWCRVQLGFLYFNSGALERAETAFQQTLAITPSYAPALFGMARVLAARNEFPAAIEILQNVAMTMPIPEYVVELGDLYEVTGDSAAARQQYALVKALHELQRDNGVQTDAELALFLADHDLDLPNALQRARTAMQERPSIFAADVLAWTLYKSKHAAEAAHAIQQALRLGTKNALMHYHAGMIYNRLGDKDKADEHLRMALSINPHFSVRHAGTARQLLGELQSRIVAKPEALHKTTFAGTATP